MNDKQIELAKQINEKLPSALKAIEEVKAAQVTLKRMLRLVVIIWGLSLIVFLLKDNANNTLDLFSIYQVGLFMISLVVIMWSKAI